MASDCQKAPKQEMDHTITLSLKGYYVLPSNQTTCHCTCICASEAALDVSHDMASFTTVCENNTKKNTEAAKMNWFLYCLYIATCSEKLFWFETKVLYCDTEVGHLLLVHILLKYKFIVFRSLILLTVKKKSSIICIFLNIYRIVYQAYFSWEA